ncbi:MAG: acetate--CoA ligase family protein [Roseovarius sp.]
MTRDLGRLFRPESIAVVGGGAWCASVIEQCAKMGYAGPVWPVHPTRTEVAGTPAYPSLDDLPSPPDAVFLGINRHATIDAVRSLSAMGAGGVVCFASGFAEAQAETGDGTDLQAALLEAAGDMPVLGPNCYGFINYLDGALLWPDQHGGQRVEQGAAILVQSSNMAINLTMQARGLPLAYVLTAGNQAQTGLAEMGLAALRDDRVTALGMHIEGIGDIPAFEALAAEARALGKPIVALKAGRSDQAQAATVSHTASLAGSDAGSRALLRRLGIAQVNGLTALLETLKLLHFAGPLSSNRIVSMSCSGGEASLIADVALDHDVMFPPLNEAQRRGLRDALGSMIALANPLDYHTFIWNDAAKMTACFTAMLQGDVAAGILIADFPRPDRCDTAAWECLFEAGGAAQKATGKPLLLTATLPEALPEAFAARAATAGMVPMMGLEDTLTAIAAAQMPAPQADQVALPGTPLNPVTLSEASAKSALAAHGLQVPQARQCQRSELPLGAAEAPYPVVLKSEGLAHKTEAGGVALNIANPEALMMAADTMPGDSFLIEEMITGAITELLVGVVRDPAHGFVLTLGAGGTMTELMRDTASLLLPTTPEDIRAALGTLRIAPVLSGYRGRPGADMHSIVDAVLAVQDYTLAHKDRIEEVEINPLIVTPTRAVAADALITLGEET